MKKTLVSALALALWLAAPSRAGLCAIDVAPARTLLLPYYEVDLTKLAKPKKTEVTTVTLTNHHDSETLVNVILWTDLAFPVMAWDIPIPPFGSQDIPLYEIFTGDIDDLPGKVPGEEVAPPGVTTADVIARATGLELENGDCYTFQRNDGRARGYITFDAVETNGTVFRKRAKRSNHLNVLTGVVSYNNRKRKYGALEHLVHLEASERLPSLWAVNFDIGSGSKTELVVWRDPADSSVDYTAVCDGASDNGWFPLGQNAITVADEAGEMRELLTNPDGSSVPGFPLATGLYQLGKGELKLPFESGTIFLDLPDSSWVGVRRSFNAGKRQGRTQAVPLGSIQCTEVFGSSKRGQIESPRSQRRRLIKRDSRLEVQRD